MLYSKNMDIEKNMDAKKIEINPIPFDYEVLRQEITDLKAEEMAKKAKRQAGENYDPHFDRIESTALTLEDLEIYKEYKEGTLTLEKFLQYKKALEEIENKNDPRLCFMAWLANATSAIEWIKKWHLEIYKKHFEGKNKKE